MNRPELPRPQAVISELVPALVSGSAETKRAFEAFLKAVRGRNLWHAPFAEIVRTYAGPTALIVHVGADMPGFAGRLVQAVAILVGEETYALPVPERMTFRTQAEPPVTRLPSDFPSRRDLISMRFRLAQDVEDVEYGLTLAWKEGLVEFRTENGRTVVVGTELLLTRLLQLSYAESHRFKATAS